MHNKLNELIIAHRGESLDAPENTIAAINLAWERKAKAVEIDIQLTNDNEIVVIHDYDTYRISGKRRKVEHTSLLELKLLDAGSHKGINWKNEQIPTLNEVLITVPDSGRLIIEIKSDTRIIEKLKHELAESGLKNSQIEIIAFNINTLEAIRQVMPDYRILWLLDLDYYWPWWLCRIDKPKIIRKIKKIGLHGVNVWSGKFLTQDFVEEFKNAGLLVYTWTVNDPHKAMELLKFGIDGITTDRAGWITEQLKLLYKDS